MRFRFGLEDVSLRGTESRANSRERELNLHRGIVLTMKTNIFSRAYLMIKFTGIAR